MRKLRGRCVCEAIRYAVDDNFSYAANCHCSACRLTTGSAFKPFAGIERERLTVLQGADRLWVIGSADSNDTRCRDCGSFLFSVVREGTFVHVTLGTLIDEPTTKPTAHIFVGSKAGWYSIDDDVPQYFAHVADGPPLS